MELPSETRLRPAEALEEVLIRPLSTPPCLVSFSGGLDSSLVLALAARTARRHGLELPVPVTWRFSDAPRAEESDWQEQVVRAVDLDDWCVMQAGDDLDFVGPVARRVLARHGLCYPANTHLHEPLVARAAGGSLLTGIGGDQVLGAWVPGRRARRLRRWAAAAGEMAWLRPRARAHIQARLAGTALVQPCSFDGRVRWQARRRSLLLGTRALQSIGSECGTTVVHPLLEPSFVAALCHAAGPQGLGRRHQLLRALFGEVVPDTVIAPRRKAFLEEVFWRRHGRGLLRAWDGSGTDNALVDPDRLRAEWSRQYPDTRIALVVQQIWLDRGEGGVGS